MNTRRPYSPVRLEGRDRWGSAMAAGREVRMWADLVKGRVVLHLLAPEPRDLGLVVNGLVSNRPLLILNPQQWSWAGRNPARSQLLQAAIDYYNHALAETVSAAVPNAGVRS
jgi:hypothetical protein